MNVNIRIEKLSNGFVLRGGRMDRLTMDAAEPAVFFPDRNSLADGIGEFALTVIAQAEMLENEERHQRRAFASNVRGQVQGREAAGSALPPDFRGLDEAVTCTEDSAG